MTTQNSLKINFNFTPNNSINKNMEWNNKFTYPKSSRSIEDGFRKYLFGKEKLPSVTSVLNATKSEEDKISLELWKKRVGYTEANKIKMRQRLEVRRCTHILNNTY